MQNQNQDKVVVVTGASRGIGKAILEIMSKAGYKVVGTATSELGVKKIKENIASINPAKNAGDAFVLDVSSTQSIEKFVANVLNLYPQIWALINNAGITSDNLFMRMKADEWQKVIKTNLDSVFYLTSGFIKSMIKQKQGRIINISSVVASSGNAGQVNYSSSKSALFGFTKSLAQEIGSRNITVNCIAPGFIQTDMTDKLSQEQKQKLTENIPLKALGEASDIANAAAFLASNEARYITGQTIHINGGLYMA